MQDVHVALQHLIAHQGHRQAPVLSLYLDLTPGACEAPLDFVHDACQRMLDDEHEPCERALAERFGEVLTRLPCTIEDARRHGYAGLALFVCCEPQLELDIRLRFPFDNQLTLGRDPALRQLLFYAEEYERCVCVIIDPIGPGGVLRLDLCEVRIGGASRPRRLHPDASNDPLLTLDASLMALLRDEPTLHFVVFAPAELHDATRRALSEPVRRAALEWYDEVLHPRQPRFLSLVHRCLQRWERQQEARRVAALLADRDAGRPAAVGLEATLEALHQQCVETLIVLQNFAAAGWRCDACDRLAGTPVAPVCTSCGATVAAVDLEDHILDLAAAAGAVIETVCDSDALERLGGIGALLLGERAPGRLGRSAA